MSMERSVPLHMSGTGRPGKRSHNAKAVEGEHGWLTPLQKSKGDPQLWLWQCRCGERIYKRAVDVRSSLKRGYVPRCKVTCKGEPEAAP